MLAITVDRYTSRELLATAAARQIPIVDAVNKVPDHRQPIVLSGPAANDPGQEEGADDVNGKEGKDYYAHCGQGNAVGQQAAGGVPRTLIRQGLSILIRQEAEIYESKSWSRVGSAC